VPATVDGPPLFAISLDRDVDVPTWFASDLLVNRVRHVGVDDFGRWRLLAWSQRVNGSSR